MNTDYKDLPYSLQCVCEECHEVVYIPTEFLDLRYGIQWARCPNCDYKMCHVKIIDPNVDLKY